MDNYSLNNPFTPTTNTAVPDYLINTTPLDLTGLPPSYFPSQATSIPIVAGIIETNLGPAAISTNGSAAMEKGDITGIIDRENQFIPDDKDIYFPVEPSTMTMLESGFTTLGIGAALRGATTLGKGLYAGGKAIAQEIGERIFEDQTGYICPTNLKGFKPGKVINALDPKNVLKAADDVPVPGSIWSWTKSKTSVENAFGHWKKHGSEFPQYQNAKKYTEGARKFMENPPNGTLTKTRANGDKLFYDPKTNTFGSQKPSGVPKTMFKPDEGIKYWEKQ